MPMSEIWGRDSFWVLAQVNTKLSERTEEIWQSAIQASRFRREQHRARTRACRITRTWCLSPRIARSMLE